MCAIKEFHIMCRTVLDLMRDCSQASGVSNSMSDSLQTSERIVLYSYAEYDYYCGCLYEMRFAEP